jgi:hypothetical protein
MSADKHLEGEATMKRTPAREEAAPSLDIAVRGR